MSTKSGHIYVFYEEGGSNQYKIGVTRGKAEQRRKQLQTGNPRELLVKYVFSCNDPYGIEDHIDDALSMYKSSRGGKEWYKMDSLDHLHSVLNPLIKNKVISNQSQYILDIDYLKLLVNMMGKRSAIASCIIAGISAILFLIWSGAII